MQYLIFDSTKLSTFNQCEKRFEYEFEKERRPPASENLNIGSIIHQSLRTYYASIKYRKRWPSNYDFKKLTLICLNISNIIAIKKHLELEATLKVEKVLKGYFNYYYVNEDLVIASDILMVEKYAIKELEGNFGDYKVFLDGKLDLIINDKYGLKIIDHKTESRRTFFSSLRLQFQMYCFLSGARRLTVNSIGTQEKPQYYRTDFVYQDELIDEFELNIINSIKRYLTSQRERNFASCDIYGGCPFISVCQSPDEIREHILDTKFLNQNWDVFQSR